MDMHVERDLRRWGNSFGVLITKQEAKELGLREGDRVSLEIAAGSFENDFSTAPTLAWQGPIDDDMIADAIRDHLDDRR